MEAACMTLNLCDKSLSVNFRVARRLAIPRNLPDHDGPVGGTATERSYQRHFEVDLMYNYDATAMLGRQDRYR